MGVDEHSPSEVETLTPRERRRTAFLDAAETLFIDQGFDRTSLAEIVRQSGGSLTTLYELFGNKQGLLRAIAVRWRDEARAAMMSRCTGVPQPPQDVLLDYARLHIDKVQSPHTLALIRMMITECLRDKDFAVQAYRDLHLPAIQELVELFDFWNEASIATIDDSNAAAELFLSLVSGDTMLGALSGVEESILDEAQVRWRLRPFFEYFKIGNDVTPI